MIKNCIQAFVNLGLINADINKQDDDYIWKGDKNLGIYDSHFEKPFLEKTRQEYERKSKGWE